jgi:hypothetical protein
MPHPTHNSEPAAPSGIAQAGVIDYLGFDSEKNSVLLVMSERRPWSNPQEQLFQLQEKLNAYLSFVLDGEMVEAYPQFSGKAVIVRLESVEKPPESSLGFLQHVYEQCALQGISFEVVSKPETCGCGAPADECSRQ